MSFWICLIYFFSVLVKRLISSGDACQESILKVSFSKICNGRDWSSFVLHMKDFLSHFTACHCSTISGFQCCCGQHGTFSIFPFYVTSFFCLHACRILSSFLELSTFISIDVVLGGSLFFCIRWVVWICSQIFLAETLPAEIFPDRLFRTISSSLIFRYTNCMYVGSPSSALLLHHSLQDPFHPCPFPLPFLI